MKSFEEFTKRFGEKVADDMLQRICETLWNGNHYGVLLTDIHQHDVCNHTLVGNVEHQGVTYGFVVETGNRNGTKVVEFDSESDCDYQPPKPPEFMFVPKDDNLKSESPALYGVYLKWTKEEWFIEKLRGYHYDRHFQPGSAIEAHYKAWADQKGLKIVCVN